MSTRRERRRESRRQLKSAMDRLPLPGHPYRDSALFYAVLSACLVGIAWLTGTSLVRGLVVGAGFFVIATSFTWYRFHEKLRAKEAAEE
jgi:hypothetical protein